LLVRSDEHVQICGMLHLACCRRVHMAFPFAFIF
jgi:hypothetical protein